MVPAVASGRRSAVGCRLFSVRLSAIGLPAVRPVAVTLRRVPGREIPVSGVLLDTGASVSVSVSLVSFFASAVAVSSILAVPAAVLTVLFLILHTGVIVSFLSRDCSCVPGIPTVLYHIFPLLYSLFGNFFSAIPVFLLLFSRGSTGRTDPFKGFQTDVPPNQSAVP